MNLETIKSRLPDYAKDLRLNLDSVLSESGAPGLAAKQIAIVALSSAIASRYADLTSAIAAEAAKVLTASELDAARAAAAIMAMNNIYYRFTHLVEEREYETMRASLRMNVMANPGASKIDFELASLAVSAVNGCGACLDSHEATLREHAVDPLKIQAALRIAAVVNATGRVLAAEATDRPQFSGL